MFAAGDKLTGFRLTGLLGSGAEGEVWAARGPDGPVALKLLTRPGAADRYRLGGEALLSLRHPALVPVLALELSADPPFLVMEQVEGMSLRSALDRRQPRAHLLPWGLLYAWFGALEGVSHLHARGRVHGDIKPGHIFIDRRHRRARLCDVGPLVGSGGAGSLALSGALDSGAPARNGFLATAGYVAPDLVEGSAQPSAGSDIYALGAVLFEVLTRRLPFGSTPPSQLVPGLPEELDPIVGRAMAHDAGARYPSVAALGEAVRQFLGRTPAVGDVAGELFAEDSPTVPRTPAIDQLPVSNREYLSIVRALGARPPSHWETTAAGPRPRLADLDCPVTRITWAEAEAFASFKQGRLPTVDEWEQAARTGAAREMVGGIWEWCRDVFEDDPERRVIKGGMLDGEPAPVAHRAGLRAGATHARVGFRCVR